jgi:hypothetical protein
MALTISRNDFNNARTFLQEYLTENLPEGDFRPGTALHDLVVKSTAVLFAYLQAEIENTRKLQSVSEILTVSEDSELFPVDTTAAIDALMSNWFLTRRSGQKVTGTVGVRFSRRESELVIRDGHRFYLEGDQVFLALGTQTFSYNPGQGVNDYLEVTVGGITLYEIAVVVEAEAEGAELETINFEDSLFTFDPISAFAVNAIQKGDFTGGKDTETNEEFVDRAKEAITKRDLSTFKSIPTLLLEEFSSIDQVHVVGYGDPEMQRDRVEEKNRCLVLEPSTVIEDEITEDLKLFLTFNDRVGSNFPKDETGLWVFNQIRMFEGAALDDGFSTSLEQWVGGQLDGALEIKDNQMVKISQADQTLQGNPFARPETGNFCVMLWVKGRPKDGNDRAKIVHTTSTLGVNNQSFSIEVLADGTLDFFLTTPISTQKATSSLNLTGNNKIKSAEDEGFSWVVANTPENIY